MEIRYEWRELTKDGLLKRPEPVGPYYDQENVNGYDGFDTEAAAVEHYETVAKLHPHELPHELVLVKLYHA